MQPAFSFSSLLYCQFLTTISMKHVSLGDSIGSRQQNGQLAMCMSLALTSTTSTDVQLALASSLTTEHEGNDSPLAFFLYFIHKILSTQMCQCNLSLILVVLSW